MMTNETKNTKTVQEKKSFTQNSIIFSFFLLCLGVVFVAGQALLLGYQYLNTFEYSDFLLSSILLTPFLITGFCILTVIGVFVMPPIFEIDKLRQNFKSNKKIFSHLSIKPIFNLVYVLLVWLLLGGYFFMHEYKYHRIGMGLLFISIAVLKLIEGYLTRELPTATEVIHEEEKDGVAIVLNNTFSELLGTSRGWIMTALLVFSSGYLSILLQNKENLDAKISFLDSSAPIEINILASNSNVLAVYFDKKIQIIPRTRIASIEYDYKFIHEKEPP